MRTLWQLIQCLFGKHKPIGFSDKRRTIVLCESCFRRLREFREPVLDPYTDVRPLVPGSLEEIRVDPRFGLIMTCLWLDIMEMANRFDGCKRDYAEGARAAAAYVCDHWKHGDHLKLIKEKDIKDRLSKLLRG